MALPGEHLADYSVPDEKLIERYQKVYEPFATSAPVGAGHVVYVSGANAVERGLADVYATSRAIGIVIAKPSALVANVQIAGRVTGLAGLTIGAPVYLSDVTPGLATSTAPVTTGRFRVQLGIADSATSVILNVRDPEEIF